eukprot:scaffold28640_cov75-Phaeocystis_antarctica.AAC.11
MSPCSAQRASTPPPRSSHAVTTCASPSIAALHTASTGSPASAATGSGAPPRRAAAAGSAAEVEITALGVFFLPLPFLAAASFSAASSPSSSAAIASAAAAACAASAAAPASAVSRLACCRSSCAVAVCFCCSAHMSAVLPSVVCSEALALASSSACTIMVRPLIAALIRAVTPKESCRSTLAPRWRIIRTIASCPTAAAPVSSVTPLYSEQPASTPPPSSSHAATACASPSRAASQTPAGGPSTSGLESTNKVAAGFFIRDLPAACPIEAAAAALASASSVCRMRCSRSSCAVAVCFACSAIMSAVILFIWSEASALASSSACAIVVRSLIAATIRAVPPTAFCRLTLAPRCSSIRTIASCPPVRRAAAGAPQRGVGLGVEQHLHGRGTAIASSTHQDRHADGVLEVDARAALQQHPHHRVLPSRGGSHQQRPATFWAAHVHAAALVQPRSHGLRIAILRREPDASGRSLSRRPRVDQGRRRLLSHSCFHHLESSIDLWVDANCLRCTVEPGCNRLGAAGRGHGAKEDIDR